MSELVNAYKEYYKNQDINSAEYLFNAILNYDFKNHEYDMRKIFNMKIYTKTTDSGVLLSTNGSAGTKKQFLFAPHFSFWHSKIEPFLRSKDKYQTIMLVDQHRDSAYETGILTEYLKSNQKDYNYNCNWLKVENIDVFFNLLNDLYKSKGLINLYCLSHIWMRLITNSYFKEKLLENSSKIHCIVNSDCNPFFKKISIYFRDQMIDWGTGLNFYTCKNENRHFLPTFCIYQDKIYNLLNLQNSKVSSDDFVELKEVFFCNCGSLFIKNNMVFHFNNMIIDFEKNTIKIEDLYDNLKSNSISVQFHQDFSEKITVYYKDVDFLKSDISLIEKYFNEKGLKIKFEKDRYFLVGNKRYLTWRSNLITIRIGDYNAY